MNKKITKLGKAVAGSALLVGATLTGAAGLASAADGSQDLGDYPTPFVDDNGEVASTIVVGESAKTVDVVGAINVAGSLGNAAFSTETQSVSGSSSSWSVSNGATLDTVNDKLYYQNTLDQVRSTLTGNDMDALQTTSFEDASGSSTDVKHYLYPGQQTVQFTQPDSNMDPVLNVNVPAESSVDATKNGQNNLYTLQANFQSGGLSLVDSSASDNRDEDVFGEEVELFGQTFTIGEDSFNSNNAGKLVLYGSSDTTDIASGESSTITIDGNEHTIEVVGVTGADRAAFRLDGTLREKTEGSTFSVNGQDVRLDDIIQTNSQDSSGVVSFSVGSSKLVLQDGKNIREGQDEDRIRGTEVSLDFTDNSYDDNGVIQTSGSNSAGDFTLNSIRVGVGANDNDNDYLEAGDTFEDPVFNGVKFSFAGLNPDAAQGVGNGVDEVSFSTAGDDQLELTMTPTGADSSTTLPFAHVDDPSTSSTFDLSMDTDGTVDDIKVVEGATVAEDQFFTADAGDFPHLFEVTDINVDDTSDDNTVTLDDYVSGGGFDVDFNNALDSNSSTADAVYTTEVIDGQEYLFKAFDEGAGNDVGADYIRVAYGNAGAADTDGSPGDGVDSAGDDDIVTGKTSVFSPLDAQSGESVSLADNVTTGQTSVSTQNYILPSTESTDAAEVSVSLDTGATDSINASGVSNVQVTSDGDSADVVQVNGGAKYEFSNNGGEVEVSPYNGGSVTTPVVSVIQPENDGDTEQAYWVAPNHDTSSSDNRVELSGNGVLDYTGTWSTQVNQNSDDDMYESYDAWGTHTMQDRNDPGSVTLHTPAAQSTVGAAFHGAGAELSASGGSNSVETMSPTGFPNAAALDSDSNVESLKTSDELILVGGPSVNALTQELADEDKTWSASDYSEGSAVVQLVNNAFAEGQDALVVAGYAGEDTREAANYISNYADNADDLAGKTQVELSTQQTQSAE